jgi:hypothetical protein
MFLDCCIVGSLKDELWNMMQAGTGIAELIAQEVAKQVLRLASKLKFQSEAW